MQDIINDFIQAMHEHGISPSSPSDIKADNKRHDFHIIGDPKNKKKGYYKLKIDSDFGFGFFGDWRQGECHSWHTKLSKKLTPEEKKQFAERIRIEKERAQIEQESLWAETAKKAQEDMIFMSECTQHPYLTKKGIKPSGPILISGANLVIPMSDDKGIWNYQKIDQNSDKLFLKDGKKQGTWFEIEGLKDVICLCEGYATGASIYEATGFTVIICFDAGNLVAVAPKIKQLNPLARIIICADNDHETLDRRTGEKRNTGIKKGIEAAKLIDCDIVYPNFTENDVKLSDFNDLHQKYGINFVRDTILSVVATHGGESGAAEEGPLSPRDTVCKLPSSAKPLEQINAFEWQAHLIKDGKGKIDPRSTVNLLLYVENHEFLKGVFKYDAFAKRIIVHKCPPWESDIDFKVRPIADYDYVRLEAWLEGFFGLKTSSNKCADAIVSVAQTPENTFNPAADYFKSLQWDGVERLKSWMFDYVSDYSQNKDYLEIVAIKFMCGLAARAMRPGVKFDTMLILEGKQYAGKSFLSRVIGTINGVEYFLDDFRDIDNKDALMKMQGKLVVEFPEISTMRRAEVNDLKAFLSRTHDVFRPPYGRNTMEAGRQCVFIGTVNPEGPYLRDVTGNRRYWPVKCRNKINLDKIAAIMPQLHAEAAHLVKEEKIQLWLSDAEYALCDQQQSERVIDDIWTEKIETIVTGINKISTHDILIGLHISIDKATPMTYTRINQTMISLGFENNRFRVGNRLLRGYTRLNSNDNKDFFEEEVIF